MASSSLTDARSPQGTEMKGNGARVIFSPDRPDLGSRISIFLAGTITATDGPDWRETLTSSLNKFPINIFNPYCADWNGSRNAELIDWELEMQEVADMVVIFFHNVSLAPISLLELGMCVKSGKAIVCAVEGYEKRVNVEAVCRRYGVPLVIDHRLIEDPLGPRYTNATRYEVEMKLRGFAATDLERWRMKDQPPNSRNW